MSFYNLLGGFVVWGFFEKSFLESNHLVRKSTSGLFNGVNIWANTAVFADKSPGGMVQDKNSLPFYGANLKKKIIYFFGHSLFVWHRHLS